MAVKLTESERIELLMMRGYGDRQRSFEEVRTLFNTVYPNRHISKSTVSRTIHKFEVFRQVNDLPRMGRPLTATNEETSLNVLLTVEENHHVSTTELGQIHEISQKSAHNILKSANMKAYKMYPVHELTEDDPDRRLHFCETITELIEQQPNVLDHIIFSDEATFCLNGTVNRHNCRYWSAENPHWIQEVHTQRPQKVNVWAGLVGNNIIGPFFIRENLNGNGYLNLLRNEVVPALATLFPIANIGDHPNAHFWFQQDGAPPHFARNVRDYLNEIFPGRWIGRRGAIEWPARSPDLSPLDFFFWGHLKCQVYKNRPHNLEQLEERVVQEANRITPEQIQNSLRNFTDRLHFCQIVNGEHFEQFL